MRYFKHFPKIGAVSALALCIFATNDANAQTAPTDLVSLSLEELLNIQILETDGDEVSLSLASGWDVRYRYTRLRFDGYLSGSKRLSFADVLEDFPVVPTVIHQEAHAFELSRPINDKMTASVVVPWLKQSTDHIRRQGDPFNITSKGLGDISLASTYRIELSSNKRLLLGMGVYLPTGSIDETGETPRGPGTQLPYTMQLGSGTFDIEPSVTFVGDALTDFEYGGQLVGKVRLGRNDRDYSLGDQLQANIWGAYTGLSWVKPSVRLNYLNWGGIDGEDVEIDGKIAPVANSNLYGGERLLLGLNLDFDGPDCPFLDVESRFFVNGTRAIEEHLTGPQPGVDYQVSTGLRFSF